MKKTASPYNYHSILENLAVGIFIVDPHRVITFWNKGAEKILGYEASEIVGKTCDYFKSPTCVGARLADENAQCPIFTYGNVIRRRCMVQAKNGDRKYLIKHAQALKDAQGGVMGGVETIVDMTDEVVAERQAQVLASIPKGRSPFYDIVGTHYKMHEIYDLIELAQETTASVIIYGETGTGKELIAHAIHNSSTRRNGPFTPVNCAALAESLLESELFGHVKGSFTGALYDRKGRFEEAHGGTICLDEIGDLPLSIQVKLLRFVQEKKISRVGDNKEIRVDVRIISATNKNLLKLIAEGRFREDLYYRLNVIPILVPPLRDRKADLPLLLDHFLSKFHREKGKPQVTCDPMAVDILTHYAWPGNIRELENALEYALVTSQGDTIRPHHLPDYIVHYALHDERRRVSSADDFEEKGRIKNALRMSGGNVMRAAAILGCSRVTLWKKMKKYEIPRLER